MNKFFQSIVLFLFLTIHAYGQVEIAKVSNPEEVKIEVKNSRGLPKELEGLFWNRWTSKNFVVCSLNDPQAQYLHKHLELVKGWTFSRWGMYDIDLSVPCKLICVDNKDIYRKLFNLSATKVEIRRDSSGKITETVIFLLIDGPPSHTVPIPLTEVCLAEFAQYYQGNFAIWTFRGMGKLNGTLEQIRKCILEVKPKLEKNEPLFYSKGILEMNYEQYKTLPEDQKLLFDNCATIFALMIRKEFGQEKYLKFLQKTAENAPQDGVKKVLMFNDYDGFDRALRRYMIDLSNDITSGKTPDSYLQINERSN
jgi:hypothetical protein